MVHYLQISTIRSRSYTFLANKLLVLFVATLLILGASASCAIAETENDTTGSDGLQILSDQKKEMEQRAFILVELLESEDITPEEYATGQTLYGKAKTALDRWLAQLQQALQAGTASESSDTYQAALQEAGNASEKFREYVHEVYLGNPRGEVARITRNIIDILQEAGGKILAELKGKGSSQDLEGKKLASFSQIEAKK